jgi:hypothetical protein
LQADDVYLRGNIFFFHFTIVFLLL